MPLAGVQVSHAALLDGVHAHPAPAVTVNVPLAPVAAADALAGEMVYVHDAAACVTVKVCPAMLKLPVREVVAVLAATV